MNAFQRLRNKVSCIETPKSPADLTQGVKYEVYRFSQKQSDFLRSRTDQSHPTILVAHVKDPTKPSKYFVNMPKAYYDVPPEDLKELNDAIVAKKPPSIVFYGNDGSRNDVLLHEFWEDIDILKLQGYVKSSNKELKRTATDDVNESPLKKCVVDLESSTSSTTSA